MKPKSFLLIASVAVMSLAACSEKQNAAPGADVTRVPVNSSSSVARTNGRLVGAGYSANISVDTANRMIASYLQSVGFPTVDSAVRSLAFDADTLRNYLANTNITSLEFFLAHQQAYLNANSAHFGKNIGMRPGALTIICVGYDNNGNMIRNSSNGVYEHALPCPIACPPSLGLNGFLQ